MLVCNECRHNVSCWNEDNDLPRVYCGGVEGSCHHMPPVEILSGNDTPKKEEDASGVPGDS